MICNFNIKVLSTLWIVLIYFISHRGAHRFSDIESLASRVEVEAIAASQNEISPNDGCNIQFTSGTTGYPKAPLLSHKSFVNNGRQVFRKKFNFIIIN